MTPSKKTGALLLEKGNRALDGLQKCIGLSSGLHRRESHCFYNNGLRNIAVKAKPISFNLESPYFCKSELFSVTPMLEDRFGFLKKNPRPC